MRRCYGLSRNSCCRCCAVFALARGWAARCLFAYGYAAEWNFLSLTYSIRLFVDMWKRRFASASPVPAYSRPYHVGRWLSPTLVRAVHLTLPAPLPLVPLRQASVLTSSLAVWRPWVEAALPFDVRCLYHLSLGRLFVAQLHLFFRLR